MSLMITIYMMSLHAHNYSTVQLIPALDSKTYKFRSVANMYYKCNLSALWEVSFIVNPLAK